MWLSVFDVNVDFKQFVIAVDDYAAMNLHDWIIFQSCAVDLVN